MSTRRRLVLALVLAMVGVAARPSPVASGPRPPVSATDGMVDPWAPPVPVADPHFATLPFTDADGRVGTWIVSHRRLPLRMVVEQEIVDRFGFEHVRDALVAWNGVRGSRFAIEVAGTVDTGAERKRRDGVSRVFLDRADCDGEYLARAHLHPGDVAVRDGLPTNYLWEADIGICERMSAERLAPVIRHEVAHVAGLGHLCDHDDDCYLEGMGSDNRCRVMYPAAYRCQDRSAGDDLGLIHLYPRLPRIPTATEQGGPAAAERVLRPRPRQRSEAVLVPEGGEARLQVEAAHLAALRDAALLVVGEDCTTGPGGEELNRTLAIHATVTLVGSIGDACATALEHAWELDVERLRDHEALMSAIVDDLEGEPRVAYVVADDEAALADAVVALPNVVARGGVLLRAHRGGLTDHARGLLEDHDAIGRVIVVGNPVVTTRQVEADLVDLRLPYERAFSGDRALTALGLWLDRAAFGSPPTDVLVTSSAPEALVTVAALAAATTWPVVLTPRDTLDGRVEASLAASATGGFVVGDEASLTPQVQVRASRAVDR